MWIIVKINNHSYNIFKSELIKKFKNIEFYKPILKKEIFLKNKIKKKKIDLFGNYIFCYHQNFSNPKILSNIKFLKGLNYVLDNCKYNQKEIKKTINICKSNEDERGYINQKFIIQLKNKQIQFLSGPLRNLIFNLKNTAKNKLHFEFGNFKAFAENI